MSEVRGQLNPITQATRLPNNAFNFQPNNPSNPITLNRLLAIVPTHLFGLPSDIPRLRALVLDPEVTIIEDAAQAMGSESNGRKLGTLADVGFLSLGRGKALSTVEGGIIMTDRDDIASSIQEEINGLPGYGPGSLLRLVAYSMALMALQRPNLFWLPMSLPFLGIGETVYNPVFPMSKMSPFQAGLARGWKKKLTEFRTIRARNTQRWTTLLQSPSMLGSELLPISYQLPAMSYGLSALNRHELSAMSCAPSALSYELSPPLLRFPLKMENPGARANLLNTSERLGVGIVPTYPDSINGITELNTVFNGQEYPVARKIARNLVTLPTHPLVSDKDVVRIKDLIGNLACCQEQRAISCELSRTRATLP
jgi:hypothetical protein